MTLAPKLGPERSKTDKSVAELNMEHHRKLPAFSDLDEEKQQTTTRLLDAETERFARVHPHGGGLWKEADSDQKTV